MGRVTDGLETLLKKFSESGLQQQVESWLSQGSNKPVSSQQVEQALGPDTVAKMADSAGVSPGQAADQFAHAIPGIVDKATPTGSVS